MKRRNTMDGLQQAISPQEVNSPNTLIDNWGRRIDYVRLAVTDRCNLRCIYCMPEKMRFLPRKEILTFEEMERTLRILAGMGIRKVRITGGEPFVRRGLIEFLERINAIPGIERIHFTSNGVLLPPYLDDLKRLGIAGVNLSLDSLDRERFYKMTRRDDLPDVMTAMEGMIAREIPLKINVVLMEGKNIEDIIPMAALSKDHPVDIRFIEEMPFNGTDNGKPRLRWDYKRILEKLKEAYPDIYKLEDPPASTAMNYAIPGHLGNVGIIAGFSRTFCGTCNRIRINARGMLHTCLYGDGVLDVRELLRNGASDEEVADFFRLHVGQRAEDGWAAEKQRLKVREVSTSMSTIGG